MTRPKRRWDSANAPASSDDCRTGLGGAEQLALVVDEQDLTDDERDRAQLAGERQGADERRLVREVDDGGAVLLCALDDPGFAALAGLPVIPRRPERLAPTTASIV